MQGRRAVVVLSGGQDSTTCLFWALNNGYNVHCVTFEYHQRHLIEIEAAERVVRVARKHYDKDLEIEHEIVALGPILQGTSPLVSNNVLEQYKDHHSLPGGIEKTFVPMRNQLFLTVASNRAIVNNCEAVVTGVCEEDYGGYPDCRRVFIDQLMEATNTGTFGDYVAAPYVKRLEFITPLMKLTKAASVLLALELLGCYEALAYTHTAYDGKWPPTGHDHATLLRAKGFEEAMVPDPLVLRAANSLLMELPITQNYAPVLVQRYKVLAGLSNA